MTDKVDVFSFGVTLWEIWMLGETPYSDKTTQMVMNGAMSGKLRPTIPTYCDARWKRLMEVRSIGEKMNESEEEEEEEEEEEGSVLESERVRVRERREALG